VTNLFKRAVAYTDLHLGLKSNSTQHNQDCLNFVEWMIDQARAENCDTCLFLGDYHNNRANIDIRTLQYSVRALEMVNDNFEQVFFIPGNHDLYYRDRRDIQSVEWARHLPNITIVNDWLIRDNTVFAPWLVGDDYKRIAKLSAQYCFGHFELPSFYMNSLVQMPDHGQIRREHFAGFDHVFTGHFHKRQTQNFITYMGNCFPHNYADAGDDLRGIMILEWGQPAKYMAWPDQPVYRVYDLSTVLNHTQSLLRPNTHARINIDIAISYEEAGFLRETFLRDYHCREIKLISHTQEDLEQHGHADLKFQSVDQIVHESLAVIESTQYDPKLLLDIYRNL